MKNSIYALLIITLFLSCDSKSKKVTKTVVKTDEFKELRTQAKGLFKALAIKDGYSTKNLTKEQISLGKALYFDKRLSKDDTQSCNTCHNLNTYGVDNNSFSKGNNGGLGGRNSPTTFNAALHIAQFWDGREADVEAQAGGPILNPVEMAMPSEKAVENKLSKIKSYQVLFTKAFPNDKKPINYNNLKKAIGAFERKLITPSKFDNYLSGDDKALSDKEKKGLQTFIKIGCTTCHSGKLLGADKYQKFGLFANYWEETKSKKIDDGKFSVTKNEADKQIFKVPSLRNIEKTSPYFHDGSVSSLAEAVRIMGKLQLNKELNKQEISEILDFLKTLTSDIPEELKKI